MFLAKHEVDLLSTMFWAVAVSLSGFGSCLWTASLLRHSLAARILGFIAAFGCGGLALFCNLTLAPERKIEDLWIGPNEAQNIGFMVALAILAATSSAIPIVVSALAQDQAEARQAKGLAPEKGSKLKRMTRLILPVPRKRDADGEVVPPKP